MEMASQALGKIEFGDGNGAIVGGGRRITGRPDRSDEGTGFLGFGAQYVEKSRSRTGLHGAAPEFDSRVFQVARAGLCGSN
jgi:hypothetical protein